MPASCPRANNSAQGPQHKERSARGLGNPADDKIVERPAVSEDVDTAYILKLRIQVESLKAERGGKIIRNGAEHPLVADNLKARGRVVAIVGRIEGKEVEVCVGHGVEAEPRASPPALLLDRLCRPVGRH